MEWKEVRLGDIVSIKSGLAYKGAFIGKGENILLGMGCVSFKDKFLFSGARPYEADCDDKYCVEPGDIVLATRQQSDNLPILAMPAIIPASLKAKKIIYGTNLYKVENHSEVTNNFLFWQLKTPDYIDYISSVKTGSVVRMVTKKNVEDYVFRCPPKEVRDRISKLLWGLDRKIELNNKINADLEEMAQAIFKNWFVDFEPFKDGKFMDSELGMIPEGWKVGSLGDMGTIVCGKTPSKANSNYYGGDIPFIKIPDMHGKVFVESSEDRLTEQGSLSQIKKLIPPYSLMVSCIATVGLVSINTKPSHTNQQINTIIPHNKSALFYLYQYIKNNEELLKNMGRGGTTTLNVNTKSFCNIRLFIPSDIALLQFHQIVEGLFKKIELNMQESRTLSTLRDTLLPRLMSGELEVPE